MLLNDRCIRLYCTDRQYFHKDRPLISPFSEGHVVGCISYGLTSAGYDLRLDNEVYIFKNTRALIVDPKLFSDADYRRDLFDIYTVTDGPIVIPGGGYILAQSMEYISIPPVMKGRCVGKSTYARCGVIVNTTPLEPEWHGHLTIEISNSNPCPVRLYVGEGIAQLEFELLREPPESSYETKGGKYQGQTEVTPARMK